MRASGGVSIRSKVRISRNAVTLDNPRNPRKGTGWSGCSPEDEGLARQERERNGFSIKSGIEEQGGSLSSLELPLMRAMS